MSEHDKSGAAGGTRTAVEIREWLVTHLATLVKCRPVDIDPAAPIDRLGLDSATAVSVTLDLEEWLGQPVDPASLYELETIDRVAQHFGK